MALVGNTFYQVSSLDPGAGFPMYFWAQTNTGLLYMRNIADTGWVLVGDSSQPYLGQLSTQGGNMNGAVTGAHGLAPADINDFTTNLYKAGKEVAVKTYVDEQDQLLSAQISTSVASALSQIPTLSLNTRVAKSKGQFPVVNATNATVATAGLTIALPFYSDGIQAAAAECLWGVSLTRVGSSIGSTGGGVDVAIIETSPRVYTLTVIATSASGAGVADWWITGYRST